VQSAARERQRGPLTAEHLAAELTDRQHQPPGQPEAIVHAQLPGEAQPGADRRERGEQRIEHRGRDGAPVVVRVPPPLAVAGGELLHRRHRGREVAVHRRGPAVGQQVGEHIR
jgi:hypothetical protein